MDTNKPSISVRTMVFTALFTAVLCVVAPFSITIGPIPLSFATLVIYLAAGSLTWKYGATAVVLYIILGAIGLPVFSNFEGGFHKIAGLTGGFIIGYIPLALVAGVLADVSKGNRLLYVLGMVIGTGLLYTCGVAWFMLQTELPLVTALIACVTPFLIGDSIKIIIAWLVAPQLRKAIPLAAQRRNAECVMPKTEFKDREKPE